jgi:hypothetical protein
MVLLLLSLLIIGRMAGAQEPAFEPPVWPTVRYGWPERLSLGVALQPPLDGVWDLLVGSLTIGQGGFKAGVGVGSFGGSLMGGHAIEVTVMRTFAKPHGAEPHASYVGLEAHVMLFNLGVRVGPAVRVSQGETGVNRLRLNVSVGLGF